MLTATLTTLTLALPSPLASPMQPPATEVEPIAHVYNVLQAADEAAKAVQSVKYEATLHGTGSRCTRTPVIEGTVTLARANRPLPDLRIECTQYAVRELQGMVNTYTSATNATETRQIDHSQKLVKRGGGGPRSLGPGVNLIVNEFNHPTPFQDELNSSPATLEGRTFIEEVLCDVVLVQYENGSRVRWFFGAEDHLPRRIERLRPVNDEPGAIVLTLRNLEVNVKVDEATFELDTPAGYDVKRTAPGSGIGRPSVRRDPGKGRSD